MKKSELVQAALKYNQPILYMCGRIRREGRMLGQPDLAESIVRDIQQAIAPHDLYEDFLQEELNIPKVWRNRQFISGADEFISFMRRKRLEFMRDQYILKGE